MQNDRENIERLSREIDQVLNYEVGIADSIKICDHTPQILQQLGLKDLPILMSQNHVRNCLHEKGENLHWHGLSKQYLLEIPHLLSNPAIIMDSLSDDESILIVTNKVDSDKNPIIISLRAYGKGQYQLNQVLSNYLTSTYGKEAFKNFLDKHINQQKLLYVNKENVQSLDQFSQLQLLRTYSHHFERVNIIHQSENLSQARSTYYNNFLYKSFVVIPPKAAEKQADQFVVGVDVQKNRFIVYSSSNPDGWKIFALPFDYIDNINTYDSDDNFCKLATPHEKTIIRKIESLKDYIEHDLVRYFDNHHNEIQTHNNNGIATQIDLISSLTPSEYLTSTCIQSWKDKYIQLQEKVLQVCDDINTEVDPFIAYLDSVEDRAAVESHIAQQTQQNNNQKDPKENGNEHD